MVSSATTASAAIVRQGWRSWPLPIVQVLLIVGVLAGAAAHTDAFYPLAAGMLLLSIALTLNELRRREFIMLTAAATASAVLLVTASGDVGDIVVALGRGATLAALLLSLSFLRVAANSSRLVIRCGRFLVEQPPGRRYLALMFGGHVFGVILNFGVLNLLGPIVARRAPTSAFGSGEDETIRRRRMMIAVVRGFSPVMMWSPTTVAQAVILSAVPGLAWSALLPVAIAATVFYMVAGWVADRVEWRNVKRTAAAVSSPPVGNSTSWPQLLGLVGIVGLFFAVAVAVAEWLDLGILFAVMIVAPFFSAVWIAVQIGAREPRAVAQLTARRVARTIRTVFPLHAREIVMLGIAGYLGTVVSLVLTESVLPASGFSFTAEPWLMAVVLMTIVTGAAQVGLNSVITVTVLGGLLAPLELTSDAAVTVGIGLALGWALAHGSSPFTAAGLMAGKVMGVSSEVIGWRWNGVFTVVTFVVCVAGFLLYGLMTP